MSRASGSCTPLPPATGGAGYYEATCNAGTKVEERPRSCFIRMVPDVTTITRSEEHTSELQSLMRISYAVFCLKKKKKRKIQIHKYYRTRNQRLTSHKSQALYIQIPATKH